LSRPLATYLTLLVGSAALALIATGFVFPIDPLIAIDLNGDGIKSDIDILAGVAFWILVTLVASALPVKLTEGVQVAVSTAPLMAVAVLGGPTAAAWVALIGPTSARSADGFLGTEPWRTTRRSCFRSWSVR
jgi:hypothetical protein